MGRVCLADGSTGELHCPSGFLVRLLRDVCRAAVLSPGQSPQLDLIRQSVYAGACWRALDRSSACLLRAQADDGPSPKCPLAEICAITLRYADPAVAVEGRVLPGSLRYNWSLE